MKTAEHHVLRPDILDAMENSIEVLLDALQERIKKLFGKCYFDTNTTKEPHEVY
jgi:hypothetical protein